MIIALIDLYAQNNFIKEHYERELYKLLIERTPDQSISHKVVPTYGNHLKFVRSKPYRDWFIIIKHISSGIDLLGTIYFTYNNEVGIFIPNRFQQKGIGSEALKEIINKYPTEILYANINPKNIRSIKFFQKHGFELFAEELKQNVYARTPCA